MQFTLLKTDLKAEATKTPACYCGDGDDPIFYLNVHILHENERETLFVRIRHIPLRAITLKLLLFGHESLTCRENDKIFEFCQRFISETKRFNRNDY